MATLYELNGAVYEVLRGGLVFDEETGEVLFDENNIDALEMARNEKMEACALFIKDLEATAAAIKAEEKALQARRTAYEKRAQRLRDYLAYSMQEWGDTRLETPRTVLSWRKSEAVEVNEAELPREWYKAVYSPDKAAIKAAIKAGEQVQGAQIVERQNLQIK